MYNGGEGKWVPIQEIVEMRTGRPGPKKSNSDPLSDVRDMEAMTSDNNAKTGGVEPKISQESKIKTVVYREMKPEMGVLMAL